MHLPMGTVTFLFTDVEGSTRHWEREPAAMRQALARHDALIEARVERHGGVIVRPRGEGDSRFAVFARAIDALTAAAALQQNLHAEDWPTATPLRVRMALHTGEADVRQDDYYGSDVNRAARLRSIAHGGQTLVSGATFDRVRDHLPDGVQLRDLGEHRLKDLIRPERIFQLVAPGLPVDFPSLRTLVSRPESLPHQSTSFIGREREVATIRERLSSADVQLLTLTGPGGMGKTRLALQVGSQLLDDFAAGVFFVPLASVQDSSLVVSAVAKVLNIQEGPGQSLFEILKDALSYRRLLLILDNFEHLLAAAPVIGELLAAAPRLKILVTSRAPLHLKSEWLFAVPPLGLPDLNSLAPLETLSDTAAVALFVERARAVKADFELTAANARAVAEICVHLDGLPLAIELAAARSNVLPPEAILGRLTRRLQLLRSRTTDAPTRHQTLRNAIGWSYDLLTPEERTLFRYLGVFVGGWNLDALESILAAAGSGIEAFEIMTSLIDGALVQPAEPAAGTARFRLLETIGEYALERLEEHGERTEIQRRHAQHYATWAETGEPNLRSSKQREWIRCLEADQANLRAAMEWSTTSAGEIEVGYRIFLALSWFWFVRGAYAEGRRWCEQLLEADSSVSAIWRSRLLVRAGALAYGQGDLAEAKTILEEGLSLAEQTRQLDVTARGLANLAYVAMYRGELSHAESLVRQAIEILQASDDRWSLAVALHMLGGINVGQGDYERAEVYLAEALQIQRVLGDTWGLVIGLYELGRTAYAQGDLERTKTLFLEMLELSQKSDLKRYIAWARHYLARIARIQGDYQRAAGLLRESLDSAIERGDKPSIVNDIEALAGVDTAEGRVARAARLFGAATALRARLAMPRLPVDQNEYVLLISAARDGAPDAWDEGQAMSLPEVIDYASRDADGGT